MKSPNDKTDYLPSKHYLLDFFELSHLSDEEFIVNALKKAAFASGATILDVNSHSFGENQGVTAVVLLAESHITIHTWPEINFAALDVFMCGSCDSKKAVDMLKDIFKPERSNIKEIQRC